MTVLNGPAVALSLFVLWDPRVMPAIMDNLPDPLPEFSDCGCSGIYYCPRSGAVECLRHSGFDVCCDMVDQHIPLHR
ncbi:hypothetical protein GCM10010466_62560 [Planomonospora alba]|uniref:Uncharacterized protein n=1 Tax=Planomonospora alba TaxID=161354 RepID=A0ABP6NZX6_9ACTN